jgi:tetratricopeptide (TPR) repeat protein
MKNGLVLFVLSLTLTGLSWGLAVTGVVRGFSIQMPGVIYFSWAAGFALLAARVFLLRKLDVLFWVGNIATDLFFIGMVTTMFLHFYFTKQGDRLLEKRLYTQALTQYQRVYGNRCLQFGYNMNAFSAQRDAAKCYCQLGNFEEAGKLYLLAVERYSKVKKSIAVKRLQEFNDGLEYVANFKTDADVSALQELARVYRYKLFCDEKAIETYRKVIAVSDSDRIKQTAGKYIEELKQTAALSNAQ